MSCRLVLQPQCVTDIFITLWPAASHNLNCVREESCSDWVMMGENGLGTLAGVSVEVHLAFIQFTISRRSSLLTTSSIPPKIFLFT